MSENTLFKPRAAPIRQPLSNRKTNGPVVNPPRMAEVGQMKLSSIVKNDMTLKKPGGTR